MSELQRLLLWGRLPSDLKDWSEGGTVVEICLLYCGLGVVWPIPCLARGFDGTWFQQDGREN